MLSHDPVQGWVQHGADISVTFNNGDQLGARALSNGDVEVYRNGSLLAARSVTSWPYYASGGYIGLGFYSAQGAKADNFGGGNIPGGATATPTNTATKTPTPTNTNTPAGPTSTPTRTPTPSLTPSQTLTPTQTASPTASATQTPTMLPTATQSPPFTGATFIYDGDGRRVAQTVNGVTTYFIGAHYEVTGSTVTKYYFAGSQRVAMKENGALSYLLSDHLGSTSLTTNAFGGVVSELRYTAWGETRYASGSTPTQNRYTDQFSYEPEFGLYFYQSRFYDPFLNHFTQPDTIVPDPYNSQDWNRYAYVRYNPLKYSDPSGHFCYDQEKNEFSNGDCFDEMQQQLLDYFVEQLESGDYTDLELMENLTNMALELNADPVIALRAASEIVRPSTPSGFGWSYETPSKFFYEKHTEFRFDDSGFGDLMDRGTPNQVAHTIGIAYIASYQQRDGAGLLTGLLVWGNEVGKNQSVQQTNIDRDLGYIASDLGRDLIANESEAVSNAVSAVESYSYANQHPVRNWWDSIQWPWSK